MKLKQISLRNFLSFGPETTVMDLDSVLYVVGPNNTGKSNIIRAIELLRYFLQYQNVDTSEFTHRLDVLNPIEISVSLEFSEIEIKALVNACICSISNDLKSELERAIEMSQINRNHALKQLLSVTPTVGDNVFRPLFENGMVISLKGPEIFGHPSRTSFSSTNDDLTLFIHDFGTLTNSPVSPSGYNWPDLYSYFIKAMARSGHIKLQEDYLKIHGDGENSKPDIFEAFRKAKSTGILGINLTRHRIFELSNTFGKFGPVEDLIRFYGSIGYGLTPSHTLGIYDVVRDIFLSSIIILSDSMPNSDENNIEDFGANGISLLAAKISEANVAQLIFQLRNGQSLFHRMLYERIDEEFKTLMDGSRMESYIRTRTPTNVSQKELVFSVDSSYLNSETTSPRKLWSPNEGDSIVPLSLSLRDASIGSVEFHIEVENGMRVPLEFSGRGIRQTLMISAALGLGKDKVVILDEPEIGLHPSLQRRIIQRITGDSFKPTQFIIVTHSTHFVAQDWTKSTIRLIKPEGQTQCIDLKKTLDQVKEGGLIRLIPDLDFKSLLFAKGVVLVEGIADRLVLEALDRYTSDKENGPRLSENEWVVIEVEGQGNLPTWLNYAITIHIGFAVLTDLDNLSLKKKRNLEKIFAALKEPNIIDNKLLDDASKILDESYKGTLGDYSQLREVASKCGIFIFENNLEEALYISTVSSSKKPESAVARLRECIKSGTIPNQLVGLIDFIRNRVRQI